MTFLGCRPGDAQAIVVEVLGTLGDPVGTQVLAPTKRGPAGIHGINATLHLLRSTGKAVWSGFAPGDPVLFLENDYEDMVFNGSLGQVEEALTDGIRVRWDGHDHPIIYRQDRRDALDLAYAISVHKAQGSQFRTVVIPVFPSHILDRTLQYTALT